MKVSTRGVQMRERRIKELILTLAADFVCGRVGGAELCLLPRDLHTFASKLTASGEHEVTVPLYICHEAMSAFGNSASEARYLLHNRGIQPRLSGAIYTDRGVSTTDGRPLALEIDQIVNVDEMQAPLEGLLVSIREQGQLAQFPAEKLAEGVRVFTE